MQKVLRENYSRRKRFAKFYLNYCDCRFLLNPAIIIFAFSRQNENSCEKFLKGEKHAFFNKNINFNPHLQELLITTYSMNPKAILIPTPIQPYQYLPF